MRNGRTDSSTGNSHQDGAADRDRVAVLDRLSEAGTAEEVIALARETTCFGEEQESHLLPIHRCGMSSSNQDSPKHFYVRRKWGIYFVIPAMPATIHILVNGRLVGTSRFLQAGDVITCRACGSNFLVRIPNRSRSWCWFLRLVALFGLAASFLVPFLDQIRERSFDLSLTLQIYSFSFLLAVLSIVLIIGTIPKEPKPRIPKVEPKAGTIRETNLKIPQRSGCNASVGIGIFPLWS